MLNLIETKRAEVAALCRRHRVRKLDVFGSAVRGDFDPATSDLDFVVEFAELDPGDLAHAYFGLKEGLETLFARDIDVVMADAIVNPYFRASVDAHRERVYAA